LLALDILRGITIAGMILVNNPGSWRNIYAPLEHAQWSGLTPTDLVFPFFMFIMGISTYISLTKYEFKFSQATFLKILKRTVVIFAIGLFLGWFSRFCYYWAGSHEGVSIGEQIWASIWTFDRIRILGVMQRLALCYGITAIVAITMKHRHIPYLIVSLLVIYSIILITGNGYDYPETQNNILSKVDLAILTPAHMYRDHGIDPEGVLSTIPAAAHVMLGFWVGGLMLGGKKKEGEDRETSLRSHLVLLFLIGTILTFAGFLLSYGLPINKKIWSPTFVLVTCGLASSFLALLLWIIDLKGKKSWSRPFESFGVNPLFLYVLSGVLAVLTGAIRIGGKNLHAWVSGALDSFLPPTLASLVYALLFVAVCWCIGYPLYKKKIYIKI
jgi:predicted acyltransferase